MGATVARPARSRFAYLAATETVAAKLYALLRQSLERSSKVAVAKFAQRAHERLGLLRIKWPTSRARSARGIPRSRREHPSLT